MRYRRQRFPVSAPALLALAAALVCLPSRSVAQCNSPELVGDLVGFLSQQAAMARAVAAANTEPLHSPAAKQVAAPARSTSADTTSLVNGAGFPELIGLALDDHLVSSSKGVTTIDLNLFAFKSLISPEVIDKQSEYAKYEGWRRWGGSLSFGGKGVSVNQAPALEAKDPLDIVNWEVRYRFHGSHDRRDTANATRLFSVTGDALTAAGQALGTFLTDPKHQADIFATRSAAHPECFEATKLKAFAARPEIAAELAQIVAANDQLAQVANTVNEQIDQSAIWTLAVAGIDRHKEFGPVQRTASLRYAQGTTNQGLTANLDYTWSQGLGRAFPSRTAKLAVDYSLLVLKSLAKDGVTLSLSGADELYQHVPAAAHSSIVKLNGKLEFPVTTGVKLPISVTWANHKDLLTGEKEIVGHFGFTFDLSQLMHPTSP